MDDFLRLRVCEVINMLAQNPNMPIEMKTYIMNSQAECLDRSTSFVEMIEKRFRAAQANAKVDPSKFYRTDENVKKEK